MIHISRIKDLLEMASSPCSKLDESGLGRRVLLGFLGGVFHSLGFRELARQVRQVEFPDAEVREAVARLDNRR
jgi:hypothetical protein